MKMMMPSTQTFNIQVHTWIWFTNEVICYIVYFWFRLDSTFWIGSTLHDIHIFCLEFLCWFKLCKLIYFLFNASFRASFMNNNNVAWNRPTFVKSSSSPRLSEKYRFRICKTRIWSHLCAMCCTIIIECKQRTDDTYWQNLCHFHFIHWNNGIFPFSTRTYLKYL